MLKIKDLKVSVEGKEVLRGVNLSIGKGEVVALMGPNGSGKSSLSNVVMGNPNYEVLGGEIEFLGENLLELSVDERARKGIMMAFQNPVAVSGVTVRELLLSSMRARGEKVSALEVRKKIEQIADELKMDKELLTRGINEGFSGGEKKKLEVLQMKLLSPSLLILDEVDSGLDIDALKTIAASVQEEVEKKGMSVLVITHYQRLLKYLIPDKVAVMKGGIIVDEGAGEVVEKLEKMGYKIYE
ncbi:MAG: Iron-sulfur cluster assembly ATPase protein SufC [Candidatus Collierbacteria bacterium GW2011_GWF2_44_15]|uniref:Iron-sulfur cluster assembly ATPase protein SufC n=4 Tax=Candidatus Collieribacteriota TaxID=1752725 RepID=A0A0G1JSM4_9BACT|nr:MAG: Iron-sulfur cluster assembly ATPase protein SufC [Candidatus Collierbacteria bacterium GW2011_GWA1_44_12]KKT39383.1 MAG: Iron-sulfur cluster assembly ATPase protein SufC [Candidatus Collierbacteria bacterium GW2011_GWF1_44_12]KKT46897.1 MAG: Iron-sulfur cluster assembly ATPase protein SufC [Candidatus Collierbacteria bacterium GW2011_GWF2_44_15]KKT97529.1 MAG: Iron-sulfur cluster assembly ATPase protein SufC [Candidatus Collierbacteria bacterium GW2011_GWC2_45_15]